VDSRSSPLLVNFGPGVNPAKVKRSTVKILTQNILKTVTDTTLDPGSLICRTHGLSIGIIKFDLG